LDVDKYLITHGTYDTEKWVLEEFNAVIPHNQILTHLNKHSAYINEAKALVIETAEKNPISDLCCTGLYFFKHHEDFLEAFLYHRDNSIFVKGEL
jgi:hypothetical protein